MTKYFLLAAFICFASDTAHSQAVLPMKFEASAAIHDDSDGISSCGIIFHGYLIDEQNMTAVTANGSIMLTSYPFFLLKAGMFNITKEEPIPKPAGTKVNWIRLGSSDEFRPTDAKASDSDNPGYYLFTGKFNAEAIREIRNPSSLWISFIKQDNTKIIYAGDLIYSPGTLPRINECMEILIKRIKKEVLNDEAIQ